MCALAVLVLAVLVGCGGSEPTATPAPASAVPQTQTVIVTLGQHGGQVTLVSTQAGGWQLNGQTFTSGSTATGQNGLNYRLTLSGSTWSAEFVEPAAQRIVLGTSGEFVSIQEREDGTFVLDGKTITADTVRTTGGGRSYMFERNAEGEWMAVFVAPQPQAVPLGTSGRAVLIQRTEGGSYVLEGEPVFTGQQREFDGYYYRFTLTTDGWTATFVPQEVTVALGNYGGSVMLVPTASGSYLLNGQAVTSGTTVMGSNGHEYRLILDGRDWTAEPLPRAVQISLPRGGTLAMTRLEDGTYWLDGMQGSSGHEVTVSGVIYTLTLTNGSWNATAQSGPLPPVVPPAGESRRTDSLETYVGSRPRLSEEGSTSTREGSMLEVGGRTYSVAQLFAEQRIVTSPTFADSAREKIEPLFSDMRALIGLLDAIPTLQGRIEGIGGGGDRRRT